MAVDQVGQTAQQALGPQTTGQLGQHAQPTRGGTLTGSPGRTAWQRMKKMVHSNQPLERVPTRLVGSAADRRQRGA